MHNKELPWWAVFISAGLGASIAEVATLPIDTAKVRLQLLRKSTDGVAPHGMLGMMRAIVREEGVAALYKGVVPAIHRQLLFASLRVGLYKRITDALRDPSTATVSMSTKILSGLLSGAIGISIANPTDLVKVRMQSEGRLAPGVSPRYSGVGDAYRTIIRTEGGWRGLWVGLGPAIARNSVINAAELASYDTARELLAHRFGLHDGLTAHICAGAGAGAMATLVGNPFDVVKTRIMAARLSEDNSNAPRYRGAFDCALQTLRKEGPFAFYQGVVPQFFRLTGWSVVMFASFEQLKLITALL